MSGSHKYSGGKRSLRTRLLINLSVFMAIIFSALWFVVAARTQKALYSALDEAVLARAESVAALLSYDPASGLLRMEKNERLMYEFRADEDDAFFQIRDASNGRICFLAPSMKSKEFRSEAMNKIARKKSKKKIYWNDVFGKENVRCLRWLTSPQKRQIPTGAPIFLFGECQLASSASLEIIVGIERENVDRNFQRIMAYSAGAFSLTFILVLFLTNLLLSYSLRSLSRLSKELNQIDKISSAISISEGDDRETRRVASAINALLERLAQSVEWERRMTSNVAHELRTPLAALRSTLEVALSRKRSEGEYQEAMQDSLSLVCQMQRLVENLLNLARLESEQSPIILESLNLTQMVKECLTGFQLQAQSKNIFIDLRTEDEARLSIDKDKLRVILNNILDNAVEYTPSGGNILIQTRYKIENAAAEILVENSGDPLSDEELNNIFKRFHRQDTSRAAGVHFGIGLNLVHSLCDLLNIQISASSRPGVALSLYLNIPQMNSEKSP